MMFKRGLPQQTKRTSSGSFAVSLAIHIVFFAVLIQVLLQPLPISNFMHLGRTPAPKEEHITFVDVPTRGRTTQSGKSGGNDHPVTKEAPQPVVAPASTPTAIPPAPTPTQQKAAHVPAGSGPVIGVGGVTQGIRPEYSDPKVWLPAPAGTAAPKTQQQRADSVIALALAAHNDSMQKAAAGFKKPGDWTVTHNGQKYGMDQQYIHIGPISIPNAVLALLPINRVQGNPMAGADEARYNARHDDIAAQARKGIDEATFNDAVRKERQRKEAEHEHEEQEKKQPPPAGTPPLPQAAPTTASKDGGGQ